MAGVVLESKSGPCLTELSQELKLSQPYWYILNESKKWQKSHMLCQYYIHVILDDRIVLELRLDMESG